MAKGKRALHRFSPPLAVRSPRSALARPDFCFKEVMFIPRVPFIALSLSLMMVGACRPSRAVGDTSSVSRPSTVQVAPPRRGVQALGAGVLLDWNEGTLKAQGHGKAPRNVQSRAQAEVLARRAALLDAQRNLLRAIQTLEHPTVAQTGEDLQGWLRGASEAHSTYVGDLYTLELSVALPELPGGPAP